VRAHVFSGVLVLGAVAAAACLSSKKDVFEGDVVDAGRADRLFDAAGPTPRAPITWGSDDASQSDDAHPPATRTPR
jgi:hypothetical protein